MRIRTFLVSTAFLFGAACRDDSPTAPVDLVRLVPVGGTQVVVQRVTESEPGTITYAVRVITRRTDLAAYQGELTFAIGAFDLVSTETRSADDGGEVYLVNAQMEQGRIRFAAYATEQFSGDEAFRFTVRPLASLSATAFAASLQVAGAVGGASIRAEDLVAMDGVRDARGRLVAR